MFRANKINLPLYSYLLKNRRFCNITGKALQKAKDISKDYIHGNWWKDEHTHIVVMTGTGIGTCIGSYHGYQESKKDTYGQCIFSTVIFGWFGGVCGYSLTMFCPFTVPIVIVATIARQMEPVQDHEKKESDIYTLHDKRPT